MKINKILVVLLLPLIADTIISCCNCEETVVKYYSNKSIEVLNLDNSGNKAVVATNDTARKEAFGIRVMLKKEKTSFLNPPKTLFLQAAYAYDCFCPASYELLPRDSITAIQIFTLNDFDTNHPANSEVSVYFKVFEYNNFTPISEYVKNYKTLLFDDAELGQSIDLLLMTPPQIPGSYKFKVRFNLSDGRIFEQESTAIELI